MQCAVPQLAAPLAGGFAGRNDRYAALRSALPPVLVCFHR
jgi:hypothetical protein